MHVLFITPTFPPLPGGGERFARSLAMTLAKNKIDLTVVTTSATQESDLWSPRYKTKPRVRFEEEGPLRVIRCPTKKMPGGYSGLLAWRKAMVIISIFPGDQSNLLIKMANRIPNVPDLENTLNELGEDFSLVHGFNISWEYPMILGWKLARQNGIPLFVTPFAHFGAKVGDRVARNSTMDHQIRILSDADTIFALTEVEKDELVALGLNRRNISSIGSGIDPLPAINNPDQELVEFGVTSPFVIFIGRNNYDKGAIHTAMAVRQLRAQGEDISLVLIGRMAPDFSRFYSRLNPNEKQGILPLGVLSETSKHALLELSSLLVLPSRSDSFGIVLLEAWAHQKTVIGARAGGIPSVIDHNLNGFIVDFGDVDSLADRIVQLLNDKDLCHSFASNGQQKLKEQYNWSTVGERVLESYRNVLIDNQ